MDLKSNPNYIPIFPDEDDLEEDDFDLLVSFALDESQATSESFSDVLERLEAEGVD